MKKFLKLVILFLITLTTLTPAFAKETYTLTAGVSVEELPDAIFGSWSVQAQIVNSSNYGVFKPKSTDLWNLSRNGNVLNLSNPFTGASADVLLKAAQGNVVMFTRIVNYDNKRLIDEVRIRLEENTFSGINEIRLDQFSAVDNSLIRSDKARYEIKGEKLSGGNILTD